MAKTIAVADQQATGMDRLKSQPERLKSFLDDARSEMRKVVTPTRAEVQSNTITVLITVFLFAAFFAVVDFICGQSLTPLIEYFTKH